MMNPVAMTATSPLANRAGAFERIQRTSCGRIVPAKAGTQSTRTRRWIPACAAMTSRSTPIGTAFVIAVVFCLWGCQTERVSTSDGWRMPPTPRATPQPPPALRADRMVFTVGSKPDDSNNNGFPDTIRAAVALFSSAHPTALQEIGTFVFTLYRQGDFGSADAKPLLVWKMSGERVTRAMSRMIAGPCYQFELSMLELGTDRLPLERADLICRFEPADSSPAVYCDGVRSIQIGRRVSADSR